VVGAAYLAPAPLTGAGPLSGTSSSSLGFVDSQLSLSLHGWLGPASSGWSAPPGRWNIKFIARFY
jgi:hypothetical protein